MSFGSLPSVLGNGGGVAISVIGGTGLFADGTAAAPSISFAADSDTGFYRAGANSIGVSTNGVQSWAWTASGHLIPAGASSYDLGQAADPLRCVYTDTIQGKVQGIRLTANGTAQNITLTPSTTGFVDIVGANDASFANALRVLTPTLSNNNSALILLGKASAANQSAFINYVYSTTASNTRLDFGHNGTLGQVSLMQTGRFLIGTGAVDSGALLQIGTNTTTSAGGMVFGTDTTIFRSAAGFIRFGGTQVTAGFDMGSAGYFGITNVSGGGCDIRFLSAGSTELRTNSTLALTLDASQNATFAGSVTATAGNYTNSAGGFLTWSGRSRLYSPSDGVVLLSNTAVSDFSRLQFGGTTASFPALKRNSATLEAKLADDSAYTNFAASRYYNGSSNVFWAFGTGSPEGVVSASVGAIYSRTDGGAVTSFYVKESGAGNTGWVAK